MVSNGINGTFDTIACALNTLCPHCGAANGVHHRFCHYCGAPFTSSSAPTAPTGAALIPVSPGPAPWRPPTREVGNAVAAGWAAAQDETCRNSSGG